MSAVINAIQYAPNAPYSYKLQMTLQICYMIHFAEVQRSLDEFMSLLLYIQCIQRAPQMQ